MFRNFSTTTTACWSIEMTIVFPPCILDFGKAYVDQPPDYSAEALAEAEQAERELFSDEEWKQVRLVRAALLRYGIHYFDARPSNIMFPCGEVSANMPLGTPRWAFPTASRKASSACSMCCVFEGGGDLHAEAGLAFGDDGEAEADDHHAEFHQPVALGDGLGFVADHDRDDGGGGIVQVEAELRQAAAHAGDVVVQLGDALRLALDDFDRLARAAGDGGGQGVGEEARPGPLLEQVDHVRRPRRHSRRPRRRALCRACR